MVKVKKCERCGAQPERLHVFRAKRARRERLCGRCHCEAKENRGITVEQIAVENARWERIFSQRFADPRYYAPRAPSMHSSFGAFAAQLEYLVRRA
jgi:hypothetical protein